MMVQLLINVPVLLPAQIFTLMMKMKLLAIHLPGSLFET